MNKKAILLGNGINLLDKEQSISWQGLLDELRNNYGITVDLDNVFKPFPLAFEEMLHRKNGNNQFDEKIKTLKKAIRKNLENQLRTKDGYNKYHKQIAELLYDDILTTNYDYSLQKSVIPDFFNKKNSLALNKLENKYSLKRCYDLNGKKIWHIHGELFDSRNLVKSKYYHEESIMIGYEHYASYLEKIQEKFNGRSGSQKPEFQSLMKRLKNGTSDDLWIDIFFTHNLDIVGLGFDFSENHLWWLINQRANYIRNFSDKHDVLIDNNITYYFPDFKEQNFISVENNNFWEETIRKRNNVLKSKAISEILEAFKVIPKSIECSSFTDFYDKLINQYLMQ